MQYVTDAAELAELRLAHTDLPKGERAPGAYSVTGLILATRVHRCDGFADLLLAPDQATADVAAADSGIVAAATLDACKLQLAFLDGVLPCEVGFLVRARGLVGRSPRGQLSLYVDRAGEGYAVETHRPPLSEAGAGVAAVAQAGSFHGPERFHLVPDTVRWEKPLSRLGLGAHNLLSWKGEGPPPPPPPQPAGVKWGACWLLPTTDGAAVLIAARRHELSASGWRLLTCDAAVVSALSNKLAFFGLAQAAGLEGCLPRHFTSLESAAYPCVLKAAVGTYGRGVYVVASAEEARRRMGRHGGGLGVQWLLQELIPGGEELSASLLVEEGAVIDSVTVAYHYVSESGEHVWPRVKEDKSRRRSWRGLPAEHTAVFEGLLRGFSGVCNFNYKARPAAAPTADDEVGPAPEYASVLDPH